VIVLRVIVLYMIILREENVLMFINIAKCNSVVTSKRQNSLFYEKFKVLEGARKNVAAALVFSLSLSQVTLVRARATCRAHLCKASDCGSTSDLKAL